MHTMGTDFEADIYNVLYLRKNIPPESTRYVHCQLKINKISDILITNPVEKVVTRRATVAEDRHRLP